MALVKIINIIGLGNLSNIEDTYGCPGTISKQISHIKKVGTSTLLIYYNAKENILFFAFED